MLSHVSFVPSVDFASVTARTKATRLVHDVARRQDVEVAGANFSLPVGRLLVTTAKTFWRAAEASAAAGHLQGATVGEDDEEAYTFDLLTKCASIDINNQQFICNTEVDYASAVQEYGRFGSDLPGTKYKCHHGVMDRSYCAVGRHIYRGVSRLKGAVVILPRWVPMVTDWEHANVTASFGPPRTWAPATVLGIVSGFLKVGIVPAHHTILTDMPMTFILQICKLHPGAFNRCFARTTSFHVWHVSHTSLCTCFQEIV